MTSFAESALGLPASEAHTIGKLHLRAERSHVRKTVTTHWGDGRWIEMPAWRFYRQVIRVGLYLRERLHVAPGDRVALLSPLRTERIVAELATVVQGAVVATLDPRLPPQALASALAQLQPKVTFASGPAQVALLRELVAQGANAGTLVAFEAIAADNNSASAAAPVTAWSEVLDLGGTLDTAERAQKFRGWIRAVGGDTPALGHTEGSNGTIEWQFLTHAEVARRAEDFSAVPGDIAYVSGAHFPLATQLAVRAFVGDGRTTVAIGTPGREMDEIVELRPQVIVAPAEVVGRAMAAFRAQNARQNGAHSWLHKARSLATLRPLRKLGWIQPAASRTVGHERLREILTLDGTRVGPTNRTTGDAQ
jgi:acyl-CoA synthetase (AMP-forming)/AMP-acid ligase II